MPILSSVLGGRAEFRNSIPADGDGWRRGGTIALPTEAVVGCTILAVVGAGTDIGGLSGADDAIVEDSRFTRVQNIGPGAGSVWVAENIASTAGFTARHKALEVCVAVVALTRRPDPDKTAYVGFGATFPTTIPGLPGPHLGALLISTTYYGVGGGGAETPVGFSDVAWEGYNYLTVRVSETLEPDVEARAIGYTDFASTRRGGSHFLIGIHRRQTVAPPCQNFPRDDTQGVGAGQNYPPPKSHQGGKVNVGYW